MSGAVLLAAVWLAGCDGPEMHFVLHDKTQDLVGEAQKAVADQLVATFGSPKDMVGWTRLPVEWGGHQGRIRAVPPVKEGERLDTLVVAFDAPVEDFQSGQKLQFTSGAYQGMAAQVLEYDPQESTLTLQQPLDPSAPPQIGDTVVLDFGHTLRAGQTAYMVHCEHCHGVSGDGNGPTAQYLNPRPRDYRLGRFKFFSNHREDRPRRDDLERTVHDGIPGTYMPSFALTDETDRHNIVEYVRWLSMRGELEQRMDVELRDGYSSSLIEESYEQAQQRYQLQYQAWKKNPQGDAPQQPTRRSVEDELRQAAPVTVEQLPEVVDSAATEIADLWTKAEEPASLVEPVSPDQWPVSGNVAAESDAEPRQQLRRMLTWGTPEHAASVKRGAVLYEKNCTNCHGPLGRGDGAQTEEFQKIPNSTEVYPEPGLFDDWGNPISPRDLTRGIYRGGRRPIDIYRRVHQGIPGTPMPPFFSKFIVTGADGKPDDRMIWDVVNYAMSLPYRREPAPKAAPEPNQPLPVEAEKNRVEGKLDESKVTPGEAESK